MTTKDILKELRRNKNLSAQQVADGCDMSLGVYKKYESGERGVGTPALLKLADFYDVTTDYLLGRPDAKPPADPVEEFVDKVQMKEQEQIILKKWLALDEKQRRVVFDFMVDIVHEYESASVQSNAKNQSETIQRNDTYGFSE
ncbi:MAG: helix-turn-helix domain-containing protein [Ruminococcus flavefaciens]|nr:helix-turn-helix domain-containing protein [Ruminococcus flavefaciens]MCM1362764.1 helix-turn-helix domain-containing protein [Clostridiales bacterium]